MPYLKPKGCEGCIFQHLSKYITPDYILPGSTEMILAQAPGAHEEQGLLITGDRWEGGRKVDITHKVTPQPLIGRTGKWMKEEFWSLTKLKWESVSKANVIKCRPHNANALPDIANNKPVNGITVPMLKAAIEHCTRVHLKIPETVKHVMAMGEISLYALSGEELLNYRKHHKKEFEGEIKEVRSTITEWRGWGLQYDKITRKISDGLHSYYDCRYIGSNNNAVVFPVVHIAALFRSDKLYHATLCDFYKFGKLVRGEWPSELPEIKINYIPEKIPSLIGFDTEYTRSNELIMWSMADVAGNTYVVDAQYSRTLSNLPTTLTIITQNGLVDIPHFMPLLPRDTTTEIVLQDCMIAHALVWAGEPTSLDYQLSKIGRYNRHKHLMASVFDHSEAAREQAYLYAGLDAETTLNSAWRHLAAQFAKDPLVHEEYLKRRQPLLRVIQRSQHFGIALDQERIQRVQEAYRQKLESIQRRAREITGNPDFNIKSDKQVDRAIYEGVFIKESNNSAIHKKRAAKTTRKPRVKGSKKVSTLHQKLEELRVYLGE